MKQVKLYEEFVNEATNMKHIKLFEDFICESASSNMLLVLNCR